MSDALGLDELLLMADGMAKVLGPSPTGELAQRFAAIRDRCLVEFSGTGALTSVSRDALAMAAILAIGEREESLGMTEPARQFLKRLRRG